MSKKIYTVSLFVFLMFSVAQNAFAQASTFFDYINVTNGLIQSAAPVVIGLAMLFFLWGTAQFLFSGGDEKKLQDTKRLMMWGIITLFVMVSVWGIVDIIQTEFFGGWRVYQVLPGGP